MLLLKYAPNIFMLPDLYEWCAENVPPDDIGLILSDVVECVEKVAKSYSHYFDGKVKIALLFSYTLEAVPGHSVETKIFCPFVMMTVPFSNDLNYIGRIGIGTVDETEEYINLYATADDENILEVDSDVFSCK